MSLAFPGESPETARRATASWTDWEPQREYEASV